MIKIEKLLLLICLLCVTTLFAQSKKNNFVISSPNGRIFIRCEINSQIELGVFVDSQIVVPKVVTGLQLREYPEAFVNPKVKKVTSSSNSTVIIPAVPEKRSLIPDEYNETTIWFKGGYGIKLRAYNDAIAWRLFTEYKTPVTVLNETMKLQMDSKDSVYFGKEDSFISHSERQYPLRGVTEIEKDEMCVLPALFRKPNGTIAAFTESDLLDYAGLYLLATNSKGEFSCTLPRAVKDVQVSSDSRSYIPSSRFDYIALTQGTREYPWRTFGIATEEKQLLENDIVYRLAKSTVLTETEWIKPGKVAWDWWNDWNLKNVPFKSGINTETYKYYIDFASKYNIPYVILDEGWSANDDLDKINPDMDMDALFDYAKVKNVKLILWVTGRALEDKLESSLNKFQKWGCAGIKMDFMIRDDQQMVNFYEKVAIETSKRQMLADFHGSYKPTGLSRTYPNQLTREGVMGLENCKWSKIITPAHDCNIAFTRMFAGPMDYTPGAMRNAQAKDFHISNHAPMSQGTRCHELAKYIVFESPLQMLCDAPTNYLSETATMQFLAEVPVVWDETHALDASIGHYLSIARRNGNNWYVGAITDWTQRDMEIDLSFLPQGTYTVKCWIDGPNANKNAEDFLVDEKKVTNADKLSIKMAAGGGFVAVINKIIE